MGTIKYKVAPLDALKAAGWSTYRLRRKKVLAESVLQQIRRGDIVTPEKLAIICDLLQCQPGDLLIYNPDTDAPQVHSNLPGHQDDKKGDAE